MKEIDAPLPLEEGRSAQQGFHMRRANPQKVKQRAPKPQKQKKPRRPRFLGRMSVKKKIFLAFIGITLLVMALLWLFQIVFLEQIYRAIKISHLEDGAEEIIEMSRNEDFYDDAADAAQRYDFCALLLNTETGSSQKLTQTALPGCHLYDMSYREYSSLAELADEAGGSVMMSVEPYNKPNQQGYQAYYFDQTNGDQIHSVIYTVLFESSDGETMALLVNTVITPISAARETLFYILAIVTGILILLSIGMAAFMARSVATPIVKINDGAKVLATGDYSHHFDEVCGYREANELAATLNYTTAELAKVENLRRELIANISHDLRTPLTLISGYSEVMRDIPGEITPENLQTIIDETARLTSLVNDMLDISKIQSGNLTPTLSKMSVSALLTSVVDTYRTLTVCRGYDLTLSLEPDGQEVCMNGDSAMLVRAVNNLINNALTYTGPDHKVLVRQLATPTRVRVEVTDTGDGIPREQLNLIWERYYKVDAEHKRSAVGTGLGLSIVKSIVIMHGGSYGVRSSPGNGSTFWIEFDRI